MLMKYIIKTTTATATTTDSLRTGSDLCSADRIAKIVQIAMYMPFAIGICASLTDPNERLTDRHGVAGWLTGAEPDKKVYVVRCTVVLYLYCGVERLIDSSGG